MTPHEPTLATLHDRYSPPSPFFFSRFLWWCAGADPTILRLCPVSDRVKYEGLGGIVFATGVLAFLSGSYAFYTIFGTAITSTGRPVIDPIVVWKAALAGLAWALVIFNIDRFIVSSSGHGPRARVSVAQAARRVRRAGSRQIRAHRAA